MWFWAVCCTILHCCFLTCKKRNASSHFTLLIGDVMMGANAESTQTISLAFFPENVYSYILWLQLWSEVYECDFREWFMMSNIRSILCASRWNKKTSRRNKTLLSHECSFSNKREINCRLVCWTPSFPEHSSCSRYNSQILYMCYLL